MQLPSDLENECNGQIVAMSESSQAYYITDTHIYKLLARDSSNTRFLITSPGEASESSQTYGVLCVFGSVVELDPCPPIVNSILRRCVAQKLGSNIVTPIYLSRLLSESNYIGTKRDVCTYLASLAMLPCDLDANSERCLFAANGEYPLARFHTGKVAEILAIFLGGDPSGLGADQSTLSWCTPSIPLAALVNIIQRVLPEVSWGVAAHAIISLSNAIDGCILSLEKLAGFVSDPTSLHLSPQTAIRLSSRQILASIVLSFITQSGIHMTKAGIHVIEFTLKAIVSKVGEISLPHDFLLAYVEEAMLGEQLAQKVSEVFSLPIIAYVDLLTPRSLRDLRSVDTSACWMAPERNLSVESQFMYIERSHLSSNPLNRAFELLDIQQRWSKGAFTALMIDVCAPHENPNAITEDYTREVGRTDSGEIVVVEKREKRILLASRVQASQ